MAEDISVPSKIKIVIAILPENPNENRNGRYSQRIQLFRTPRYSRFWREREREGGDLIGRERGGKKEGKENEIGRAHV